MRVVRFTNADVLNMARDLAHRVGDCRVIYGILYNGIPVAYVMRDVLEGNLTDNPKFADLIVDAVKYCKCGSPKCHGLVESPEPDTTYIFPWEPI